MSRHTTLRLNEALLRRAKVLASRQHLTLTAVMERALTAYLANAGSDASEDRAELPSFGHGGTRAGVDLDRTGALLDLMDSGE